MKALIALFVALLMSALFVGFLLVRAAHAAETPSLSPLELVRVENVNLRLELRRAWLEADACRGQLAQPRADAQAKDLRTLLEQLKADIERAHPGYTWESTTGTFAPKDRP